MADRRATKLVREQAGTARAESLLERYYAELSDRFPEGFELAATVPADLPDVTPPRGDLVVVVDQTSSEDVAVGAVRLLGPDLAEIKRMWVAPAARGRGIGRLLLEALEAGARDLGATTCVLDTSRHLPEALALYRSAGYAETDAYNDNPYAHHWFAKAIVPR